jgi:hypothetical protein
MVAEDVDVQQERREVQAGRGWQEAKVGGGLVDFEAALPVQ